MQWLPSTAADKLMWVSSFAWVSALLFFIRASKHAQLPAGSVRYWLSAGRGGFGLSPQECIKPIFYVMAYTKEHDPPAVQTKGLRVCSSPVPCKDSYSATVKSTNYLLNAMNLLDAQVAGCDQVCCPYIAACIGTRTHHECCVHTMLIVASSQLACALAGNLCG